VRRHLTIAAVLMLAAVAGTLASRPLAQEKAQEKRWAAIDPNSEASSPVAWGETEEQARQRAVEACKRASKTCANGPASTDNMNDVFAIMCCTQPKHGCAVGVEANRQKAPDAVKKTFGDAGYTNCALRHYMSAGTGQKQQ